jgi:hypothetical protein
MYYRGAAAAVAGTAHPSAGAETVVPVLTTTAKSPAELAAPGGTVPEIK